MVDTAMRLRLLLLQNINLAGCLAPNGHWMLWRPAGQWTQSWPLQQVVVAHLRGSPHGRSLEKLVW